MKRIISHLKDNWIRHSFETLVVVAGVLIAFTLNDWNESRKDRESEIKILKELKKDLEDNYDEISGINILIKNTLLSTDSLIIILDNALPSRNNIKSYDALCAHTGFFNSANTAYRYIEVSGMKVLRNDSIRILTTQMYEKQFKVIFTEENLVEQIKQDFFLFIRSNFIIIRRPGQLNQYAPIDSDDLCTNTIFKNLLAQKAIYLQFRNEGNEETLRN